MRMRPYYIIYHRKGHSKFEERQERVEATTLTAAKNKFKREWGSQVVIDKVKMHREAW